MTRRGRRPAPVLSPTTYVDDTVITRQTKFVRAVVLGLGLRGADVQDVVQATLLGAWRSMSNGRFTPRADLPIDAAMRVWLFGIAVRQTANLRERAYRRRERPSGLMFDVPTEGEDHDGQVHARLVLGAMPRKLRPKLRVVYVLAAEGFTVDEMARMLGIPVGTTASRVRRMRLRVATLLARMGR